MDDDKRTDPNINSVENGTNESANVYHIDPAEEARVLRRIDWCVMPAMVTCFFFQFLDKQTINYASVFGLSEDLDLSGSDFSWAVSLFYFGQLASQYPTAYLISRFPVVKVVSLTIVLWGAMEMCLATPQSAAGLNAVRFLLGLFEGASAPGFVVITSNFYKRKEHPVRVAFWQSCSGLSQIIGALVMYGIGGASGLALENWRVMFLICGAATITAGLVYGLVMPRDTSTAWFLKPEDRQLATERLALDRATRDKSSFDVRQVKEALLDVQTWLLFCMGLFICLPSPILKFSSLVINGFGFGQFQTMLVGLPGGVFQIATIWAAAFGCRYTTNKRWLMGILLSSVPLLGSILLMTLPASAGWGIVVSTWLAACSSSLIVVALSFAASNVKGNTKKATVSGVFFLAYCTGCIVGPQLWQAEDAPRYIKGTSASVASWVLFMITLVVYRMVLSRENAKRDRDQHVEVEDDTHDEKAQHMGVSLDSDMTDRQDLKFRYTL
ncbi:uncharacterized protein LTR77_003695 [Saxophila tyrrhenica]|uniref:Major facilitator superfamily (MFS) profile domain-containing protein n=1 Tax=Saxophila tyrrhenica TaxID=1690608 RepID=A0AAV9PEB1_9PEZI|nr:hypothetical protein LTR77_003695 [Saxophila tyrrhenica]